MSQILEVKNLTVRYPQAETTVFPAVDINFSAGEFILVAGPSGGGKSTFLHALNGLIPQMTPAELTGGIYHEGTDLTGQTVSQRSRVLGTVMQNPSEQIIFESVFDELAFPLENIAVPPASIHARIEELLQTIDLRPEASPTVLSGGEKQKLVAAGTLIMGQKLLLFDEVLANLDESSAYELLDYLQLLCREQGYTVIFVEHRLDWVLQYADRVLWIAGDELREFSDLAAFQRFWQDQIHDALAFEWPILPVSPTAEVLIEARGASFTAGGRTILQPTDFTLRRGERWVLIGANGSGKTSFLNVLAGLTKPTQGSVYTPYAKKDRYQSIGVIMQDPNYQLFMSTVQEEIDFRSTSPERTRQLMEALELEGLEERHPQSLSEGQKRKVGVAAILAMDPEILLFDEPTVGLDYRSLGLLLRELKRMDERSPLTMLTITHDNRAAHYLGDQVIRMDAGQLTQVR